MPFLNLDAQPPKQLLPGVTIRPFWGDKLMLVHLTIQPNALVPEHTHPHEQMGYIFQGSCEMTIGTETKALSTGDSYLVPSNMHHSLVSGPTGVVVLDIFSPPREEYKPDVPVITLQQE